jgi:formamidopyrimidine-DNA glycosylase
MPELPEVETIVRRMRPEIVGRTITTASLLWERTLATPKLAAFNKNILGQKVDAVNRRAKYIVIQLSVDTLIIHLRMSGDILFRAVDAPVEKHDRLLLTLDDEKVLAFNDMRKFGRVWLTPSPNDVLGKLGPEPLEDDFTSDDLFKRITAHTRQIKPLLLDQHIIAGLGNIYTDEALHLAGLHPLTKSDMIKRDQAERLWRSVRQVLNEGIERNGTSIDWIYRGGQYQHYLHVYGRADEPCLNCGTPIQKIVVGQRGTHFCPQCQKVVK